MIEEEPSWLEDGGGLRGEQSAGSLEDETGPYPMEETQTQGDDDEGSSGDGLPSTDGLDQTQEYALVINFTDGEWKPSWAQVPVC